METYSVFRFYADESRDAVLLESGLTLEQAQAHCGDPETSSETATVPGAVRRTALFGPWFDGYRAESV